MLASRMDLLSQMLTLIRMQGVLVFTAELRTPWGLRFDAGSAYFLVVSEGTLTVTVEGEAPVEAVTGDLLMLPRGGGFAVADGMDSAAVPVGRLNRTGIAGGRLI